jgi:hypothetical protein
LQASVDRQLNVLDFGACLHPLATFPSLHPNAGHVGFDLAIAIFPDTAARAIAKRFWTIHGARHAGIRQHALPTHPAIEQKSFYFFFNKNNRALNPMVAD